MAKKVLTKVFAVLLTAAISMGTLGSLRVSANNKEKQQSKQARYIKPAYWDKEELKAYQFDSWKEFDNLKESGISYYYTKNFKPKSGFIKVTIVDAGVFVLSGNSYDSNNITLYNSAKKKISSTAGKWEDYGAADADYYVQAKAGDVFYIKPKDDKQEKTLTIGVIKDSFSGMKKDDMCYQAGTGSVTYHPFSISDRSEVNTAVGSNYKTKKDAQVFLEQYSDGKWTKMGKTLTVKAGKEQSFCNGLAKGKYRIALNVPKDQLVTVYFNKEKRSKNVAYKRSKAKAIKYNNQIDNIYTQNETAARWYKVVLKSKKEISDLSFVKDTASGGYKFTIYKKGRKKALKTIKVTKNGSEKYILLSRQGTYYIKVSKLTRQTNGEYYIDRSIAIKDVKTAKKQGRQTTRKTEPEEWNKTEIMAYKFGVLDEVGGSYLNTGGVNYYSSTYFKNPQKVKIKALEAGTFFAQVESNTKKQWKLYDSDQKLIGSFKDIYIKADVKAGESYYVEFPDGCKKGNIMACVIENKPKTLKKEVTNIVKGEGKDVAYPINIKKRSYLNILPEKLISKKDTATVQLQKQQNKKWINIGSKINVKANINDEYNGVHYGVSKGNYRIVVKADKEQAVCVEYRTNSFSKNKIAYKQSKAKKIPAENIYTEEESASRWYKVSVKSKKDTKKLGVYTMINSGGYKFTVYKKGQKKSIKTVKATKKLGWVRIKFPKKTGTYYIKVSKLTKKTSGLYRIESDDTSVGNVIYIY